MYTVEELRAPVDGKALVIKREDGTQISTISSGHGAQDIVLAHGYGANSREWNVLSRRLDDEKYRLIVFDQRGHGNSTIGSDGISSSAMASDYKAVLDTYDVKDGILGAHSMGGFLAMKFLLTYPDIVAKRLKGCLLIATFAGDINRDNFQNRLQIPLIKSGVLVALVKYKAIGNAFAKTLIGDKYEESMATVFVDEFRAQNHNALVPILSALGDENYYPELKNISIPCTIIVGTSDKTTPAFHTDELHANIPDSQVVKISGCGHLVNWEEPEILLREIERIAT